MDLREKIDDAIAGSIRESLGSMAGGGGAEDPEKSAAARRASTALTKIMVALPTLDARGMELLAEKFAEAERLCGTIELQKSGGGRPAAEGSVTGLRKAFDKGNLRVTDLLHGRVRDVTPDGEPILAGRR